MPPRSREPRKPVNVSLSPEVYERLQHESSIRVVGISKLVETAIVSFLDRLPSIEHSLKPTDPMHSEF